MSVQCVGITTRGTQCRNWVTPPERCCYHHKIQCGAQQGLNQQQGLGLESYRGGQFNNVYGMVGQQQPQSWRQQQSIPPIYQPQPWQGQQSIPIPNVRFGVRNDVNGMNQLNQWPQQTVQTQPTQPRPMFDLSLRPTQPSNVNIVTPSYGRPSLPPSTFGNPMLAPLGVPGTPVEAVLQQNVQQRFIPPIIAPLNQGNPRNQVAWEPIDQGEAVQHQGRRLHSGHGDMYPSRSGQRRVVSNDLDWVNRRMGDLELNQEGRAVLLDDDEEVVNIVTASQGIGYNVIDQPLNLAQPNEPEPPVIMNRPHSVSPALAMLQERLSSQHIIVPKEHQVDPEMAPPIPATTSVSNLEDPGELHDCYICYDDDNRVANRNLLVCGHAICVPCLSSLRQTVCPFCRAPLEGPLLNNDLYQEIEQRQADDEQQQRDATELVALALQENPEADPDELYNRYVVGLQ